jgi:hypothetical protein
VSYIETHEYVLVGEGSHGKVMLFGDYAVKKYNDQRTAKKEADAMLMF